MLDWSSVIRAEIRVRLPEETWISRVSRSFPEATFRLLTGFRTGDVAIELGEAVADRPRAVADAIDSRPEISNYRRLTVADDRVLGTYETADTAMYEFVERSAIPPAYPVVVRNGRVEFDLTTTREEFDRIRADLESAGVSYDLVSLVETADPEGLLTERQREVLEVALRKGYFTVPRECTLSEVAAALEVDTSTASEVLRRGENRIVRWFLTGGDRTIGE